jgi:hypothetical protein
MSVSRLARLLRPVSPLTVVQKPAMTILLDIESQLQIVEIRGDWLLEGAIDSTERYS